MKTKQSIKNLVGRAVAMYNLKRNDAKVRVEFLNDREFWVHTTVALGDNVPWAKVPMTYIWNSLNRFGIKQDFQSERHTNGNVSCKFIQ